MSWGRAAKGTPVWYWVRRGALSPRPVRGSAAGIGYLKVGEFTAAPPVPRRRNRAWNVGAAPARAVRSSARRRARSSGASGPQCRDRGATTDQVDLV